MSFEERKKQIDQHFKTLTIDQFEKNIEKAGIKEIQPSNKEMLIVDVDLSLDYIKEVESKLTESQIKEFADDYNLSYDEAKQGLAEYIAYNLTILNS